ncbi:MAG: secondary thiamine-phosphate synthase enzyme YjbQ [Methanolobus sp.]|nr:secondary thiamine-phosphate synthase enzyme YjbQ [Methanolobus sp.]
MELKTNDRVELIDITDVVQEAVKNSAVENGICVISTRHTTTSIIVNENESGLRSDILSLLERFIPADADYSHDRIDNNADAHLKAVLLGSSQSIPILCGRLLLGTWQSVFFAEFDGPRNRSIEIMVLSQR